MSDIILKSKLDLACRIAKSYFDRGMGSGTTGNLSFMHGEKIYITAGGTCFGFLTPDDFAVIEYPAAENGSRPVSLNGLKPSKELPLHMMVYDKLVSAGHTEGAVIHTHSTYGVLWSCMLGINPEDCVPDHTPYLRMKMGSCGLISYHKPGSEELFEAFRTESGDKTGWLLAHHGLITGGSSLMDAFGKSEELEESCKIAWMLHRAGMQ